MVSTSVSFLVISEFFHFGGFSQSKNSTYFIFIGLKPIFLENMMALTGSAVLRFPFDLDGGTKRSALITTAHNLEIHNREKEFFLKRNICYAHVVASRVFAHSLPAKQRLVDRFQLPVHKVEVIRHGDLSVALGPPHPAKKARTELALGAGKLALVFGAVEPYKGLEEIIDWWRRRETSVDLAIVGRPNTPEYGARLSQQIGDSKNILCHFGWVSDEQLRLWLSAADAVVFNYREIFTSGAASLTRSYGVPIILPRRLDTVALDEPTPYVRRFTSFATDFADELRGALAVSPDFNAAHSWRDDCSWDKVAAATAAAYRDAVG